MVIFLVILFKYKNAVKNRHVHVLEEYSRSNNHATLQRRIQLKCNIRTYVYMLENILLPIVSLKLFSLCLAICIDLSLK